MKKILLSTGIIILMMMLFVGLGTTASAETYGDLTYKIVDGEIAITDCNESVTEIVIPDEIDGYPVTVIGDLAFCDCYSLKNVTMGNNIKIISAGAFYFCGSLESMTIPDSVTEIGGVAFGACSELKNITIGKNVKIIGECAFDGCINLENIVLPEELTTINWAFAFSGIKSITIPGSVKIIGDYAFNQCENLETVIISDGVTEIGGESFANCFNLNSIIIPESVSKINAGAFAGCSSLANIKIPDGVTLIDDGIFSGCGSLTDVTIPQNVTSIGAGAFSGCKNLKNIEIPHAVETLPKSVFYNSGLEKIIIGDNIRKIDNFAFADCEFLENVVIGNNVVTIGAYAFYNCTAIESISIPVATTFISEGAFADSAVETIIINNPGCYIELDANTIPETAVIYGYEGSYAQIYAQTYGREFVSLADTDCIHKFGKWTVNIEPTCTQRGFKHRVCEVCNRYEFDVVTAAGHKDADKNNICDICDEKFEGSVNESVSFLDRIVNLLNSIVEMFKNLFFRLLGRA